MSDDVSALYESKPLSLGHVDHKITQTTQQERTPNMKTPTKYEIVRKAWFEKFMEANIKSKAIQRMASGDFTKDHYIGMMQQIYLQVRENPSLQALSTSKFRGAQRDIIKMYLKHAVSEVGHDDLVLDDLKALGVDVSKMRHQKPIPSVAACIAFPYWAIHQLNPMTYLGFIFHLEAMPTNSGNRYMEMLKAKGIPESAMTFIQEHATVDIAHNKLMAEYLEVAVQNEEDLEAVIYGAKVGAELYFKMVDETFEWVDNQKPSWGIEPSEVVTLEESHSHVAFLVDSRSSDFSSSPLAGSVVRY